LEFNFDGAGTKAQELQEHIAYFRVLLRLAAALDDDKVSFGDMIGDIKAALESGLDPDSTLKARFLGKRLRSVVHALGTDDVAYHKDLFADLVDPFPKPRSLADEDDDGSGSGQDGGEDADCATDPLLVFSVEMFDLQAPTLRVLDGNLMGKLNLAKAIVVGDVVKPLIRMGCEGSYNLSGVSSILLRVFQDGISQFDSSPLVANQLIA
jgi:hypothetical protein